MSGAGNDGPIFRRPSNLDKVWDASIPSEQELLSPQATLRYCSYMVSVENDGQNGVSTEDKAFTVKAFGNFEGLGYGKIESFTPLTFDELVGAIRERLNANAPQLLTVWSTSNLATSAKRISSDQHVSDAIWEHFDLFQAYPLDYPVLYFFVEFGNSDYVPRAGHFQEEFDEPFIPDTLEGGVSPSHIPEAPTGPEPDRTHVTSPNDSMPRAQPKRTKTFESGKKAVSKLTIAVKNAAGTVKDIVSPREPPEQHTVLTALASTFDEEDYLTSLLATTGRRFEQQTDIDHDQAQLFHRFARLFPHIDPRQHSANERSINFRHCALAVTPHQFVRACQILFQYDTTGLAGGLLASAMGSGKSIIVLSCLVIRALLFESKRRVEREWEEMEKRRAASKKGSSSRNAPLARLEHLPRNAAGGQGCPTQRERPHDVVCFCVPDGATRNEISKLKPGASLIHVPSAAAPGWIEILEAALFNRRSYNVTVLYNGPRPNSRLEPSPDFLGGTRFNRWQMSARLPPGHPGGLITRSEELDWFVEPAPLSDPSLCLETYIIVTTHANPRLRELFSWETRDLAQAPQNCQFPPGGLYALLIGITFIDEAHKVLQENSLPLQMARQHRNIRAAQFEARASDLWLVSGTPFGAQLKDLAAAVSLIAPERATDATALHTTYEAIAPAVSNTPKQIFETLFHNVFHQLVIRDDFDTTWLGQRVSDTRNVRPQYISRNTPQSQLHHVRLYVSTTLPRGPPGASYDTILKMKQSSEHLFLLSMFPSAAIILLESPELAITDLDTHKTVRNTNNTTGESLLGHKYFQSFAEKLSRGPRSPKLEVILNELELMAKDNTPRPQSKSSASANVQSDLKLKKMVIITPTFFTALMLYIILARYHSRAGPVLYHQDLKQSQRQDVLRRFNSLHKRDGPWRTFIAPASVASEALNLQVANRLILTSPLVDVHQQNQALARVNRVGQCFDVVLKILILEDSPIDRMVIANRAGVMLENDPFNVDESVVVVR